MKRPGRIEDLIREHYDQRPLMRAADVYKLLFQGMFGVGHILGEGARRSLDSEAGALNLRDHPEEPLLERISADGSMVRVNLRPYLRQGLPLDELFGAMQETAKVRGDPREFLEAWAVFRDLARSGALTVDQDELESLERELEEEGISPHHHSEEYRIAYYPAYRVVREKALEKALGVEKSAVEPEGIPDP